MKIAVLIASAILTTGCATRGSSYQPLIDTQGKDATMLATDTSQCQAFAKQRMDAASGAVAGAIAGAIIGALLMPKAYRSYGVTRGALSGAVAGGAGANDTQESIIKKCLANRGYSVLD